MYVIKVGDFYVCDVEVAFGGFIGGIKLSKEIMGNFSKDGAERIAKMIGGEVIDMGEVVTNDEESI